MTALDYRNVKSDFRQLISEVFDIDPTTIVSLHNLAISALQQIEKSFTKALT